ncbi:28S ribosomal protein S16, mitochondrial-like isoform X1 [Polyodon spathula]|uniref:28S ribosomal protein S16, mitochondrial-like isoform X1 n=1 Tax=Polyodon spathula TaxID=7913 RepID=UPI001B7DF389|nr:28S ribosomal protein S16, mitochondrial-like isoform X1 [Polyodon spathula]
MGGVIYWRNLPFVLALSYQRVQTHAVGNHVGISRDFQFPSPRSCVCVTVTKQSASLLLKHYHGGHVVIRLALGGCTNRPFYRIVAAYNKRARDSKHLEQLGSFDPLPNTHNEKLVSLNFERIKYWIACGAHPTKPVAKLLGLSGFFPLHPMTVTKAERLHKTAAQKEALGASKEGSEETSESKPEAA